MSDEHVWPTSVAAADTAIGNRKKDKVRAAWISFVGRIVAQFIGAAASILLGLMFVHKYQDSVHSTRSDGVGLSAPAAQKAMVLARDKREPTDTWIAVLPLEDFSPDGKQQQIANGLTEALITALSNVEGLRVVSRTSSMRFKGISKSLPEIGRELDVNWIVEGSVLRDGDRIRVTAQLIDTASDEHVWATAYDRQCKKEVLSIQASVASEIAKDVESAIGREQHRRLMQSTRLGTPSPIAAPRSSPRPVGTAGSRPSAALEGIPSPATRSRFPEF